MKLVGRCLLLASILTVSLPSLAAEEDEKKTEKAAPDRAELEKQFAERLTNCVLVGSFTIVGRPNDKLTTERYEIESVTKLRDDYWTFLARIQYGTTDVKLPIALKVAWAGDTPMITMTDVGIPGMGTFTARILFYGDRYAGTWQHGPAGGHMFGIIEKNKPGEAKADEKPAEDKAEKKE